MNYSGYSVDKAGNKYYSEMYSRQITKDLNEFKKTGLYYCNSCTNRPVESNGYLFIHKASEISDDYVYQKYITARTNITYQRVCADGIWSTWRKEQTSKIIELRNSLENNWQANGQVNGFVIGEIKILSFSVRRGTATQVITLPEELRPTLAHLTNATNFESSGYVLISTDGTVTVSDNLFVSGSSSLGFNAIYV